MGPDQVWNAEGRTCTPPKQAAINYARPRRARAALGIRGRSERARSIAPVSLPTARQEMKAKRGGAEPAVAICAACGAASLASAHVLQAALVHLQALGSGMTLPKNQKLKETTGGVQEGPTRRFLPYFSAFPAI